MSPGVIVEQRVEPLGRVGCYVPGGRFPLPSSLLMTAIPARVAGVPDVIATNISYYDPIYGFYDPFLYGPPYGHHLRHQVPVRRVIVQDHDRSAPATPSR